jgi:DnaJ family protein C protein 7
LQAKKEAGNTAFKAGNYDEAYNLYTESLEIDPDHKSLNAILYCNRATVLAKVNRPFARHFVPVFPTLVAID